MKRKLQVHAQKDVQDTIKYENQRLLSRLMSIQPCMSNDQPKKYHHMQTNKKRQQLLEFKYTEIERENRILLEKLQNIIQKGSTQNMHRVKNQSITMNPMSIGISNEGFIQNASVTHTDQKKFLLNEISRKKMQEKIQKENMLMLRRLQNQGSSFNICKWDEDEQKRQQLLKQISIMPQSTIDISRNTVNPPDPIFSKSSYNDMSNSKLHMRSTSYIKESSCSFIDKKPTQLEIDRLVVYKKGTIINHEYFIVEMSYNTRGFFVSLYSVENMGKSLVLELEKEEKTKEILEAFNHDYELMSKYLRIVKGKIKIMRPQNESEQNLITLDMTKSVYNNRASPEKKKPLVTLTSKSILNMSDDKDNDDYENQKIKQQSRTTRNSSYNSLLKQQDQISKNNYCQRSLYKERPKEESINAYTDMTQQINKSRTFVKQSHMSQKFRVPPLPIKNIQRLNEHRNSESTMSNTKNLINKKDHESNYYEGHVLSNKSLLQNIPKQQTQQQQHQLQQNVNKPSIDLGQPDQAHLTQESFAKEEQIIIPKIEGKKGEVKLTSEIAYTIKQSDEENYEDDNFESENNEEIEMDIQLVSDD